MLQSYVELLYRYKILFINFVEDYRTHDSYSTCIDARHCKRQKNENHTETKKMKRIQAFFVSIMWLHKTAFFYLLDTA